MSTINLVKYYFHKSVAQRLTEQEMTKLVALAYQTAVATQIYPRSVFIRSDIHDTTSINGVYQKDPGGPHITICYKDSNHVKNKTHIACHGYVDNDKDLNFLRATDRGVKKDSTKKRGGGVVWPSEENLWVAPEIGYGHLETPSGFDDQGGSSGRR